MLLFDLSEPLLLCALLLLLLLLFLSYNLYFPRLVLSLLLFVFLALLLGPCLDLVIGALNIFVGQVSQNALTTTSNNWAPNRFQRIAVYLNILQLFVLSKKIRQLLDVIVQQC